MARYTPLLWKHKPQPNGHFPIWLRFSDSDRTLYASLGVNVHPRFWNEAKREVRKGHPQSEGINSLIQARLNQVETERLRLLREGEPVTAEALKDALSPPERSTQLCFLAYAREKLAEVERRGNINRVKKEGGTLNKLEAFAGSPLPFGRITPGFLRKYEAHLIENLGNKPSTVQANVSTLRAHYRRAVRDEIVPQESDPFVVYSPPKAEKPERHKLTADELARIEVLQLGGSGPAAPFIARVRHAFLFSLYGAGIRFADVAKMRVGNIKEDADGLRLAYRMGKTGKRSSLRLVPKAEAIVRPYMFDETGKAKTLDDYLFPMLEGRDLSTPRKLVNAISAQNTLHNRALKSIAEKADVSGKLSFHIARHSFADLARKGGWDVYEISKALAHSGLNVTEHYLAGFDNELVDSKMSTLFEDREEGL